MKRLYVKCGDDVVVSNRTIHQYNRLRKKIDPYGNNIITSLRFRIWL
ncbi:hypothetical protein [Muribaculum gordoncarteri]